MNIPQELGSYMHNLGNHSSASVSPDYLYSTPIHAHALHHHPNPIISHQCAASGGCASSQPSSDDDLTYYNIPSTSISLPPFQGSENVTTSLYGLVTATPVPTTHTSAINSPTGAYAPQLLQPRSHSDPTSNHGHSPSHQGRNHRNTSSQRPCHTQSSQYSGSQQSYSGLSPTLNSRGMGDVRVGSPSAFHPHHHKSYHNHHHSSDNGSHHRKRKSPVPMVESDDDDSETCSSKRTTTPTDESSKKQNHSEIEKRRRDKMNTYITELSGMVPMCSAMSRKLDKLTVLRMAVQHMKTLRGSRINSYTEGHYKPSFLSDVELKHLILQSAEGFLFVVGCDRGRLLYVSESVSQVLNYTQSDLLGQSWFDILHPKDVAKVKEQLSSSDLSPRERLIDAKTMLPVKGNVPQKANRLCPGARRSFFCRMKYKNSPSIIKEENDSSSGCQRRKKSSNCERKFCVIHCTGYLKSWAKVGVEDSEDSTDDPCNLSCLVAVGRIIRPITAPSSNSKHRSVTFVSRHAIDGKFVFVDQRTTLVVGFLPQELLGTSMYEYFHHDDIASLADVHKAVLASNETLTTSLYRFRARDGNCVRLQSSWKAFRNPWTRDIEYIIARNTLAPQDSDASLNVVLKEETSNTNEFDFFAGTGGNGGNGMGNGEIQRFINSEGPFRKIGEQIADEIVESQRRNDSSSSSSPVSVLEATALGSAAASITDLQLPSMSPSSTNVLGIPTTPQSNTQTSSQSSQNSVQRQMSTSVTSCSPNSTHTPGAASTCSESSVGDGIVLSNRTIDPLMGSTAAGAGISAGSNGRNVPNGNNAIPPPLRNAFNVSNETDEEMLYMIGESVAESTDQAATGDGNDEAAMAVIMSLLEADAGLGGPVDFSGLPWPLP